MIGQFFKKNQITNVYTTDTPDNSSFPRNFISFLFSGKKGTKATVEFQLDVSKWDGTNILVGVFFYPIVRSRGVMGFLRDCLVVPLVKDAFSGEFKDNPYYDSKKAFILLIAK